MMPPRTELTYDGKSKDAVEKKALRVFAQLLGKRVSFCTVSKAPAEFSSQQLRGEYPIDVWHDSQEPVLARMK
jgi:hypothetical protein